MTTDGNGSIHGSDGKFTEKNQPENTEGTAASTMGTPTSAMEQTLKAELEAVERDFDAARELVRVAKARRHVVTSALLVEQVHAAFPTMNQINFGGAEYEDAWVTSVTDVDGNDLDDEDSIAFSGGGAANFARELVAGFHGHEEWTEEGYVCFDMAIPEADALRADNQS